MEPRIKRAWPSDEAAAAEQQEELRALRKDAPLPAIQLIAGTDVAYSKEDDALFAAVVVLDAKTHEVVEVARHVGRATFAYVPGLLSFRELPPLVECLAKLEHTPDLVVCDGNGLMHPRRFGLASHLGVLFDCPTIGCAKNRLLGVHGEPKPARGSTAMVIDEGDVIGTCLRTQDAVKPLYVSVGHRSTLREATAQILALASRFRLPETTRQADQEVNRMRREIG